jgi:hypothetical protein
MHRRRGPAEMNVQLASTPHLSGVLRSRNGIALLGSVRGWLALLVQE